jgi:outer membrane protein assembly factor BamB
MHRFRSLTVAAVWLSIAVSLNATESLAGDNWPQFRGPSGDGHSDAVGLPLTWSETEHIRWKTPIHDKAWSSPMVWGNQIWLTTATADGKEYYAISVDLASGRITRDIKLWDIAEPQFCHPYNSYASCTPVIEAGCVYVHFGSFGTAAIDTNNGEVLWARRDLPCDHFRGPGSSPILVGNMLILTFDGFDFQYVTALDKRTGATLWRTDRNIDYGTEDGDMKKGYVTPHIVEADGRRELISPSAGATIAYDPLTGKELWRVRSGGMNSATRPLFGHGLIYCTTASRGFQLFATRPGGDGDVTESRVVWKQGKSIPSRSSPLLIGERLFMSADGGVASCVNALNGEQIWQKRLDGKFTASPVFADGRIYFFSEEGSCPVIEPADEYRELAVNKLADGCMASPAVVGKSLIVRTKTALYRIEN